MGPDDAADGDVEMRVQGITAAVAEAAVSETYADRENARPLRRQLRLLRPRPAGSIRCPLGSLLVVAVGPVRFQSHWAELSSQCVEFLYGAANRLSSEE